VLLEDIVSEAASSSPRAAALLFEGSVRSFGALATRVRKLAAGLEVLTRPGDRVAVLAENCPAYVECLYGVPAAGTVLVLLNYRLHPEELAAQLARAEPSVLIGERLLLDSLAPYRSRLACVETTIAIDNAAPDELSYESVIDATERAGTRTPGPDDVAWLIFTSGTTGAPKGAMLTHRSLGAALVVTDRCRPVRGDDVYLFPFPLCHVSAYNVLLFHQHARPVVLARRFTPEGVAALVAEYRVTAVSLAPTMLSMLLDDPAIDRYDLSSLRSIGYGASSIPESVLRRAAARFGCEFSQGYGMTELSGNAVFLDADAHRRALGGADGLLRAAGRVQSPVEVRIVDDDLHDVAAGEPGEIVVRAEQMMARYWRDPAATSATIAGGWLRTGDVGRLDHEGFLFVVDRKKDIIVTGGENVSSREVEDVVRRFTGVRDVAVVGIPDDRWGERVCAVVVPEDGMAVEPEELVRFAGAHLAGFKKPRQVELVDALPVNAAGKVLKAQLRDTFSS